MAVPGPERFEALILGSGNGGMFLAWDMAASGHRTAVVERRYVGGSCPNINCLPSKNEIWSAKVADLVHHGADYGAPAGDGKIDMAKVRQRKREMVERLRVLHLEKYKTSGVRLIMGSARLIGPKTIEVSANGGGTRVLAGDRVFLNLGTHAAIPNIPGLESAKPLTNIEALELDHLPQHLIVLGGGYVGLEFAQAYRRFGSRVSVIQSAPQLMEREDPDLAAEVQRVLEDEGVDVLLSAETLRVEGRSGESVRLFVRSALGERTISGSDILVAAGRVPNTAGIGLEAAGIKLDSRGYIAVNERLETSAPGVWAIGECAGSPQFTHVSFDDFRVIRDNLAGGRRSTRGRVIPYCMFTDPPLARVGLSEREARAQNIPVRVAKLPMTGVLRTWTTGEMKGFMKAVVSTEEDRILGFGMVGADAGEVVAVVQTAMLAGLPYDGLRDAIFAHPTIAEGLNPLFSNVPDRARLTNERSSRRSAARSAH